MPLTHISNHIYYILTNEPFESMKSSNNEKQKITGFFGFFDILGFKEIIDKNGLDYLCNIIGPILDTLDGQAITMGGVDQSQDFCIHPTNTFVFSDTIILYEKVSQLTNGHIPNFGPTLIEKAAILTRLAFEKGVPLRGAISFGEYVVTDRYFFGKPILEAYLAENKCKWSGVLLCDSVVDKMRQQPPIQMLNWRGMENISFRSHPFNQEIIVSDHSLPNGKIPRNPALRWDDILRVKQYAPGLKSLNDTNDDALIRKRVVDAFSQHNKSIDRIKDKIENTTDYLLHCRNIPIAARLQYTPPS